MRNQSTGRVVLVVSALLVVCGCAIAAPAAGRVSILWQRAKDQIAAGKPDAALASAEKAVKLAPDDPEAWWCLGWVRERRGEPVDCEVAYRHAVELDPSNATLYNNLGWTLFEQGESDAALMQLRKAVSLDHEYSQAHHNLGLVLEEGGWLDAAAECWRTVVALGDDRGVTADAHNSLGYYHAAKGEWKAAMAEIRQSLALYPGDAGFLDSLGSLATLSGDLANGEKTLRRALAAEEPPDSSRAALAFNLAQQGRSDEALAELGKLPPEPALEGPDMDIDLIYFTAKACAALDNLTVAQEMAAAFVERWPKVGWAEEMETLSKLGHTGAAYMPIR